MSHHAEPVNVRTHAWSTRRDSPSVIVEDIEYDVTDIALETEQFDDMTEGTLEGKELEESLEAEQLEESSSLDSAREPAVERCNRSTYGIMDILFPMTPPKPKGARLVRGPLKFNQP